LAVVSRAAFADRRAALGRIRDVDDSGGNRSGQLRASRETAGADGQRTGRLRSAIRDRTSAALQHARHLTRRQASCRARGRPPAAAPASYVQGDSRLA